MKKFLIAVMLTVLLGLSAYIAIYQFGLYVPADYESIEVKAKIEDKTFLVEEKGSFNPLVIKGVNMGVGIPGKWATEYAIDKKTYLKWFDQIKEMGANTLRVYTILQDDFYEAFYEYNKDNPQPLYLIHGVWVNDYVQNSHSDGFDEKFQEQLIYDCRTAVDILHGRRIMSLSKELGMTSYTKDISPWVIGYIIGVEWEDVTVIYTDKKYPDNTQYKGKYLYTSNEATAFERMLAEVGDKIVEYETEKYGMQKPIAFSNWPTTDPFDYPESIRKFFMKCAKVDVEHIKTTEDFLAGQFVSYHVYPYYPDYLAYFDDKSTFPKTEDGQINTYAAYLKTLAKHHTMPVVISEFGVSTGRGMAQRDMNTGRNQGNMSETKQGEALVECFKDIIDSGCIGGCVFTWQDEWFKRTWNTMQNIDLKKTPYWSDYQTNEQYFGLLSFDPGKESCISYVDGDIGEWESEDLVIQNDDMSLSMKYDEKFIYFLVEKRDMDIEKSPIYIPMDINEKIGSSYCKDLDLKFQEACDFLVVIDGKQDSRVLVQERYDVLKAMFSHEVYNEDAYIAPPDKNSPNFVPIKLMLQTATPLLTGNMEATAEVYETGKLLYGNSNPKSKDYNSLADYIVNGNYLELKLPWQLLNFSNPSDMTIHDDYYQHYGIEYINIDEMRVGIGTKTAKRIPMNSFKLSAWGKKVSYHERLKPSYYILQEYWTGN